MFFFFNDTATTEIYTLSLHDALPILAGLRDPVVGADPESAHALGDGRVRRADDHAEAGQQGADLLEEVPGVRAQDRKSTRLNSSHANISYAVFCLKKKNTIPTLSFYF